MNLKYCSRIYYKSPIVWKKNNVCFVLIWRNNYSTFSKILTCVLIFLDIFWFILKLYEIDSRSPRHSEYGLTFLDSSEFTNHDQYIWFNFIMFIFIEYNVISNHTLFFFPIVNNKLPVILRRCLTFVGPYELSLFLLLVQIHNCK